ERGCARTRRVRVSAGSCCVAHRPPSLSASGTGPDGGAHPIGRAAHSGVDDPINFAPHGSRELLHSTINCRSNDRFRRADHRVPYRLPDRSGEYLQYVVFHRAHDAAPSHLLVPMATRLPETGAVDPPKPSVTSTFTPFLPPPGLTIKRI